LRALTIRVHNGRVRLAWFSPMPPVRSGIATCSAALVHALRQQHEIDIFVDEPGARGSAGSASSSASPGSPSAQSASTGSASAHEFIWRHAQRPYDLTVYQLGNSSHHDYLWPYLFRFPGLAVLHDVHLHHARAANLLRERRAPHYRAEFAGNEPHANPDAAELAVAGFDSRLLYEWPFIRLVVLASRMTAVHSPLMLEHLRSGYPQAQIEHVRLGHGTLVIEDEAPARAARARARFGIPDTAIVFGCFGGLTPDKRIPQILSAFAALLPYAPQARLLLAGSSVAHYDIAADVLQRGLTDRVLMTGYLESDDELTDCIAACDVTLNLRWPTARETSGPWLRCLAAGRASITIDLAHTADAPSIDPRTWRRQGATDEAPVSVALDILDEDHSLRIAMRRLAADRSLRDALGAAAREYWTARHSPAIMVEDYRRVLRLAADAPVPEPALPAHLRNDASGLLTRLLGNVGVAVPWSKI
jgi:glycosyltransferase involved in cell wall biosynthesis